MSVSRPFLLVLSAGLWLTMRRAELRWKHVSSKRSEPSLSVSLNCASLEAVGAWNTLRLRHFAIRNIQGRIKLLNFRGFPTMQKLNPFVKSVNLPLQQSPWLFFGIAALGATSAVLACTYQIADLFNETPKQGELGYGGRFEIVGVTKPFQYPFRLLHASWLLKLIPWIGYLTHQYLQWRIIYEAKKAKDLGELEWTEGRNEWNPFAYRMLLVNITMIVLHFVQCQITYVSLASTFPEISTLFSGIGVLVAPMVFDMRRRGLVFGWSPDTPLMTQFQQVFRKYHAYLASLGMTLTFWFHTFEATLGHLTGLWFIFMLFMQSSLIMQKMHRNRYWTMILEMAIMVHGTTVAYYQGFIEGVLAVMFFTSYMTLYGMSLLWGIPAVHDFWTQSNSKRLGLIVGYYTWLIAASYFLYSRLDQLSYIYLLIALPSLYYSFLAYYFVSFVAGRWIDTFLLCGVLKMERKSRPWWYAIIGFCALSIAVLMVSSDLAYRYFILNGHGHH
jgi:hypothetical protein